MLLLLLLYLEQAFRYFTVGFICTVIVFGFPLIDTLIDNPNYKSFAELKKQAENKQFTVYEYNSFGPEIIWDYGTSHSNILDYQVRVTADDRYQIDIQPIVDQVDTMNLYQDLQWMSAGVRDHATGLSLLTATKDSITDRFNTLGFEVVTQAFFFTGDSGHNVIGRKPGVVEDSITFINDANFIRMIFF